MHVMSEEEWKAFLTDQLRRAGLHLREARRPGELLVRVRPTRVVARAGIAD